MKKLNVDFGIGIFLLLAAYSKLVDELFWVRVEANYLIGIAVVLDLATGVLLVGNRQGRRARQFAFCVFLSYSVFLLYQISQNNWTCQCFGGANSLVLPLVVDAMAMVYFGFKLYLDSDGSIDYPFCLLLGAVAVLAALFLSLSPLSSDAPLEFVDTRVVEQTDEWKKCVFVVRNRSQHPVKLSGIRHSCAVFPTNEFPLFLDGNEITEVDILVRVGEGSIMGFVDGKLQVFVEVSGVTRVYVLRWGLAV